MFLLLTGAVACAMLPLMVAMVSAYSYQNDDYYNKD